MSVVVQKKGPGHHIYGEFAAVIRNGDRVLFFINLHTIFIINLGYIITGKD